MTGKRYSFDYTVNPNVGVRPANDGQGQGPRKFFNAVNFAYDDDDSETLQSAPRPLLKGPFDWIEETFGKKDDDPDTSRTRDREAADQAERIERAKRRMKEAQDKAETCVISYPEVPSPLGRISRVRITSDGPTSWQFPTYRHGETLNYRIPMTVRQQYVLAVALNTQKPAYLYDVNRTVQAHVSLWQHGNERNNLDEHGYAVQWAAYSGMRQINTTQMMQNIASENGVTFARPFQFVVEYLETNLHNAFEDYPDDMPTVGFLELSTYNAQREEGVEFLPSQVINDVLSYVEVINYDNQSRNRFTMEISSPKEGGGLEVETHEIDMGYR